MGVGLPTNPQVDLRNDCKIVMCGFGYNVVVTMELISFHYFQAKKKKKSEDSFSFTFTCKKKPTIKNGCTHYPCALHFVIQKM